MSLTKAKGLVWLQKDRPLDRNRIILSSLLFCFSSLSLRCWINQIRSGLWLFCLVSPSKKRGLRHITHTVVLSLLWACLLSPPGRHPHIARSGRLLLTRLKNENPVFLVTHPIPFSRSSILSAPLLGLRPPLGHPQQHLVLVVLLRRGPAARCRPALALRAGLLLLPSPLLLPLVGGGLGHTK